jgi:FAD binding domain
MATIIETDETGGRGAGLAFPGDPGFQDATGVFNLYAPPRPVAATTARTVAEVRAAIRHADAAGLTVRVHATGHSAAAARPMRNALLIRTRLGGGADGVRIDPARRTARIAAGTPWGAVVEAAAEHGLAAPHGSSPTVGAVGFLLRGGLNVYGRKVGLGTAAVRAVEVVTGDGEARRVDPRHDPELFWALRSGGGGFGVVTAVEIDLFPAAGIVGGAAYWPVEHAARLLEVWLAWSARAPEEATTAVRVMNLPPLPELPRVLTAGPVFCVAGVVVAETADAAAAAGSHAEDLLGPLRSIAAPLLDDWGPRPLRGALDVFSDPPEPVPFVGDHMLLADLGAAGAAAFLEATGAGAHPGGGPRPRSPLVIAALRQLGGAYRCADPAQGPIGPVEAAYAYSGSGIAADPAGAASVLERCATVREALLPWDTGRTMPSFVERFDQPQGHLRPDQIHALDRIRGRVDPRGLFRDDVSPHATALGREPDRAGRAAG